MTTLVLVRHVAVVPRYRDLWVGGGTDAPADSTALAASRAPLATRIAAYPPDHVVVSPLRRARETADLLNVPYITDRRLAERDFGPWEGRPIDECLAEVPAEALSGTEAWLSHDPGGETLDEVVDRVTEWWKDHPPVATLWCVAHGGVLAILRSLVLNKPLSEVFTEPIPHGGVWVGQITDG